MDFGVFVIGLLFFAAPAAWILFDSSKRYDKPSWVIAMLSPFSLSILSLVYLIKRLITKPSATPAGMPQPWQIAVVSLSALILCIGPAMAPKESKQQAAAPATEVKANEAATTPSKPAATATPVAPAVDHYNIALTMGAKGKFERAIAELEQVQEGDPHYEKVDAKRSEYRRYIEQQIEAAKSAAFEAEIREAQASRIPLKQIVKSPDAQVGTLVAWKGEIMQISEEAGKTFAQISYYDDGITSDNFFVELNDSVDVYKGDSVVVYGRFDHMKEYESQAGYQMTSPWVSGLRMQKIAPLSPF